MNLGRLDANGGDVKSAEAHYRAALDANPDLALTWYDLGVICDESGRRLEAINAYQSAIRLEPGLADAHYNLSMLLEVSDASGAFRHLSTYRRLRDD